MRTARPPRILHIQKVKGMGGAERHLLACLPALMRMGHDVRMIVLATAEADRFIEPLRAAGVSTVLVPPPSAVPAQSMWGIVSAIRSFRPDLVHTHLFHADVLGQTAAQITGVPGVSTFHNANRRYGDRRVLIPARVAGRLARRTIAISGYVKDYVERLRTARSGTIRLVPYGIDARLYDDVGAERERIRRELGFTPEDVIVSILARLIPGKGHAVLLDALKQARAAEPSVRLMIAGDGPLREELATLAAPLGDVVRFAGYVPDVRPLLAASDLVTCPTEQSLGEGFGLTALEAMAVRRPVIASDTGALPEIVRSGITGLVVQQGSSEALANAIVSLARDERRRRSMGDRAREDACGRFSLEGMVEATADVYRQALMSRVSAP